MNKLLIPLLTIVLVISVCANIYLWRQKQNISHDQKDAIELKEEHAEQLDVVQDKLNAAQQEIEELKEERDAVLGALTPMAADDTDVNAETKSILDYAKENGRDVFADATNETSGTEQFMSGLTEMMDDPQMRDLIRSQVQNTQLDALYGRLFSGLGLSSEDESMLRELLTDELLIGLESMQLMKNPDTADSVDDIIAEKKNVLNEEMKELLGEEKYEELEEYRSSLQERAVVGQLNQQLVMSGSAPLSPMQQDSLIDIMTDERIRVEAGGESMNLQNASPGDINDLDADEFLRKQVEIHQGVRERADGLLTAEQMKSLERFQDMYLQQMRMGIQMSKSMFSKDKK